MLIILQNPRLAATSLVLYRSPRSRRQFSLTSTWSSGSGRKGCFPAPTSLEKKPIPICGDIRLAVSANFNGWYQAQRHPRVPRLRSPSYRYVETVDTTLIGQHHPRCPRTIVVTVSSQYWYSILRRRKRIDRL